jgi:hypothetical protein
MPVETVGVELDLALGLEALRRAERIEDLAVLFTFTAR